MCYEKYKYNPTIIDEYGESVPENNKFGIWMGTTKRTENRVH